MDRERKAGDASGERAMEGGRGREARGNCELRVGNTTSEKKRVQENPNSRAPFTLVVPSCVLLVEQVSHENVAIGKYIYHFKVA